ncbi:hypothetical protein AA0312_2943 [Acetobacter tropicalis NRIC 0312]|nr:hypothetical protein ATR1_009d0001 [Acetobacter tropicalis]GBR72502.1 hypothetical protein AA0312_2943 [Acetobacter tropicalis NRIC 0312]GEL51720.1 hypothetical protein ATR01nite_27950 [Acetobacter tropicalis]
MGVDDEKKSIDFLKKNRIIVSSGSKHSLVKSSYIRVSYSNLEKDYELIGNLIVKSASYA